MKNAILTLRKANASERPMNGKILSVLVLAAFANGGCVQVSAPDEPIVIELNVNVQQTVDVNLQQDVENLIESNPELFPE